MKANSKVFLIRCTYYYGCAPISKLDMLNQIKVITLVLRYFVNIGQCNFNSFGICFMLYVWVWPSLTGSVWWELSVLRPWQALCIARMCSDNSLYAYALLPTWVLIEVWIIWWTPAVENLRRWGRDMGQFLESRTGRINTMLFAYSLHVVNTELSLLAA